TIQQIGARYNAFTSKAMTCYYLTVPAQHVGTALNLIADWVTRPIFPQEDFEREWGVVQRELEMGASDPIRQLYQIFDELRYNIHPARFPIIGHQSVLQQLTRQQILDYYHLKYVPDNCVLVIAGDINTEQMLQAVKKEFADFNRKSPPQSLLPTEPDITAPRQIVRLFPAMQGPANMIFAFPSFNLQHPDLYALDTLASILGQGKSSRFYKSLREDKQLVLSIKAMNYTPNWADGSFYIMSQLDPENVPAVKRALWQEIEKIKNEPVQPGELARAKRQLQVGHIRSHQTAEQVAASMAEDYLATGDPHFSDHYVENMQAVTAEMVQKAAQKYLLPQKQLTAVITPKPLPPDQSQPPKTAAVSKIKKITLENGLTILLKRDSSVPLVNMRLYVLGGLLDETDENNGLTNLMVKLSLKATQNYSTSDIVDYFDSVGGLIVTGAGNNTY
ncbi:MAG: insulinase family protein, partial [Planctomycetes bacterium]|nr:insulinase family protein [Planctomycetota bacterium]